MRWSDSENSTSAMSEIATTFDYPKRIITSWNGHWQGRFLAVQSPFSQYFSCLSGALWTTVGEAVQLKGRMSWPALQGVEDVSQV